MSHRQFGLRDYTRQGKAALPVFETSCWDHDLQTAVLCMNTCCTETKGHKSLLSSGRLSCPNLLQPQEDRHKLLGNFDFGSTSYKCNCASRKRQLPRVVIRSIK